MTLCAWRPRPCQLLDRYIISSSALIAIVVFENGLAGRYLTDETDAWMQMVVLLLWALVHAYFLAQNWMLRARTSLKEALRSSPRSNGGDSGSGLGSLLVAILAVTIVGVLGLLPQRSAAVWPQYHV